MDTEKSTDKSSSRDLYVTCVDVRFFFKKIRIELVVSQFVSHEVWFDKEFVI